MARKLFYAYMMFVTLFIISLSCNNNKDAGEFIPSFKLIPSEKFYFNNFVDCNMAEAWIADTFRIFPGKYGEDTLWGDAKDLKFATEKTPTKHSEAQPAILSNPSCPRMPRTDRIPDYAGPFGLKLFTSYRLIKAAKHCMPYTTMKTIPSNYPFDPETGKGYKNEKWPQGLQGPSSPAAVCRMGIMKSTDGGRSWENKGIILEDLQPRLILKPHNTVQHVCRRSRRSLCSSEWRSSLFVFW